MNGYRYLSGCDGLGSEIFKYRLLSTTMRRRCSGFVYAPPPLDPHAALPGDAAAR